MLLTGFDAPMEQVLYLDRHIKEAELLQAIARVNRTATGKTAGYVVDYYGVAEHLKVALAAYAGRGHRGGADQRRRRGAAAGGRGTSESATVPGARPRPVRLRI